MFQNNQPKRIDCSTKKALIEPFFDYKTLLHIITLRNAHTSKIMR